MIRITKNMMTNPKASRKEPPAEVIRKQEADIRKLFSEDFGWEMTELADKTMPVLARRDADFVDGAEEWDKARKGVALLGNVGTGKTILLNFAAYIIDVSVLNVPELSRIYATGGPDAFWSRAMDSSYIKQDMMLDDLGAESSDVKQYGVPFPIVDLIYRRYDIWQSNGHRLWLSSNLTGRQIADRYGERVADRIKEMCVVVPATGESLR